LEILTGVVLAFAFISSVIFLINFNQNITPKTRIWLLLFSLGILYFLLEDQNYGQYYFQFNVPDYFLEHNKEKELNIHNISSWFNQKPRFIVEIWILCVGILVPLGWKFPKKKLSKLLPSFFWVNKQLFPLALTIFIVKLLRILQHSNILAPPIHFRYSELHEYFIAYFMLGYIILVARNIKKNNSSKQFQKLELKT